MGRKTIKDKEYMKAVTGWEFSNKSKLVKNPRKIHKCSHCLESIIKEPCVNYRTGQGRSAWYYYFHLLCFKKRIQMYLEKCELSNFNLSKRMLESINYWDKKIKEFLQV